MDMCAKENWASQYWSPLLWRCEAETTTSCHMELGNDGMTLKPTGGSPVYYYFSPHSGLSSLNWHKLLAADEAWRQRVVRWRWESDLNPGLSGCKAYAVATMYCCVLRRRPLFTHMNILLSHSPQGPLRTHMSILSEGVRNIQLENTPQVDGVWKCVL